MASRARRKAPAAAAGGPPAALELRGHDELLRGLWRAAARARLPHALCFEGPSGIGKYAAARRLAQGLLCARGPGEPCGSCGPCRRVLSGGSATNHPDLHVLDPLAEGEEHIKIERVAERDEKGASIEGFMRLKPLEGGWRIVLVREAERMLPAAQNALLKTLEEPTPASLIALETARAGRLLATIRSRCTRVRVAPLSRADTRAVLAAAGVGGAQAEQLARWSGGSPGEALRLRARGAEALRPLLAEVLAGERGWHAAARAALALDGDFGDGKPLAQLRERARAVLDLALAVLADLVRAAAGAPPEGLRHGDLGARLALAEIGLEQRVEALLEARQDVELNLAPEALVERAFLALAPR